MTKWLLLRPFPAGKTELRVPTWLICNSGLVFLREPFLGWVSRDTHKIPPTWGSPIVRHTHVLNPHAFLLGFQGFLKEACPVSVACASMCWKGRPEFVHLWGAWAIARPEKRGEEGRGGKGRGGEGRGGEGRGGREGEGEILSGRVPLPQPPKPHFTPPPPPPSTPSRDLRQAHKFHSLRVRLDEGGSQEAQRLLDEYTAPGRF